MEQSSDLDPAAVFAGALSIWNACWQAVDHDPKRNLSEVYHGGDEFMRQLMRVASLFESWCADRVDFECLDDVWPYLLEDRFGDACLEVMGPECFASFDEMDCLRVALHLRLPVKVLEGLAVPVNLTEENTNSESSFCQLQIRTVRRSEPEGDIRQYGANDDPEDPDYGPVIYGLYGLESDGIAEHIADRDTYAGAKALALKLAPGIPFPEVPTLLDSFPRHDS
ncbi:hypothetical protein DES53_11315 [Roseimicrobium gellanilyticum]|uniref:Uncharacterized protein n=1 Tax=Roseimicrobium gellanilyticum TaxID=748857 RepID=A0A366H6K4_9BACT|nr:hypothetical protein [Roseimicrobium gellanilyticum]RBP37633.1 hypothetical protein DES53_11315 [Roseimicrobium gellanilyticum]